MTYMLDMVKGLRNMLYKSKAMMLQVLLYPNQSCSACMYIQPLVKVHCHLTKGVLVILFE